MANVFQIVPKNCAYVS